MTDPTQNPDPMDESLALINALLDGRLDAAGARRLEELVLARPDVRRLYVHYLHQECVVVPHRNLFGAPGVESDPMTADELRATGSMKLPAGSFAKHAEEAEPTFPRLSSAERHGRVVPWRLFSGIAAAVAIVLGVSLFLSKGTRPDAVVAAATIAGDAGAQWDVSPTSTRVGTAISPSSQLRLKSGVVELVFGSGARVIVEGPATFTPDSTGQISLSAGQLTAVVPPRAVGFSVKTPSGTVVDLGTEFGVSLRPDGSTEVEVFTGRVQARPVSDTRAGNMILSAGQAARVSANSVAFAPPQPQRYLRRLTRNPTTRGEGSANAAAAVIEKGTARVDLSGSFNRDGITEDGQASSNGGIDAGGSAYSAKQLAPLTDEFALGKPGVNNVIITSGQTVPLPRKAFSELTFLAAGVNGKKPDMVFTVRYTDGTTQSFTQSVSNWNSPSDFDGEAVALEAEYRNDETGKQKNGRTYVYRYKIALNGNKVVSDITLPKGMRNLAILAINLVP